MNIIMISNRIYLLQNNQAPGGVFPESTRQASNAGSMVDHRPRRWPKIDHP